MFRPPLLFALAVISLTFIPAYAEVTSLQADRSFYSIDMSIYFTGTVATQDSQKLVNLMIQDSNGKIVLMTGKYADSNNAFQIIVNTNDQNQFNLKGTYSASAFVNSKQDGKTIFFDFSPDGSPVFHPSESKNNAIFSQNEVNGPSKQETNSNNTFLSDENVKIVDFVNMSKKIAPNNNRSEVISSSPELANVLYPLMAACGAGLVGFIIYQRKKRTRGISEQSNEKSVLKIESDQDYALKILKNRLAKGEITLEEFKMTRDALSEP